MLNTPLCSIYKLVLLAFYLFYIIDYGYASFLVSNRLNADDYLYSVSPDTVGTEGGALLTLTGYGILDVYSEADPDYDVETATTVTINDEEVEVLSANITHVSL